MQNEAQYDQGLDKNDKREWLFKRLGNIEGKIKGKNKKELKPIKNEEQSEVLKDESTVADKKPRKIVLLKDELDFIFTNLTQILIALEKKFL